MHYLYHLCIYNYVIYKQNLFWIGFSMQFENRKQLKFNSIRLFRSERLSSPVREDPQQEIQHEHAGEQERHGVKKHLNGIRLVWNAEIDDN